MNESMGKMKRKSSFNSSSEKKLRSINCIENLSNELFYEIFDYFDPWDIYIAFSNLNHRFQQLLNNSSVLYKIKLIDPSISEGMSVYYWAHIMCLNRKQVFSIQLSMLLDVNRLFSTLFIDSSLHCLQSLVLIEPKQDKLMLILEQLINLPHFCSITIEEIDHLKDLTSIYRIILGLPMLTYCKISIEYSDKSVSLPISTKSSPLEHLIMNHSSTFNELSVVLSYTPHLRHLGFMESDENNTTIGMIIPLIPIHLTYLCIDVCHVTFDEFEMFIRQLRPKLKVLMFSTSSEEIAYFNAYRWEKFILQDLPQLKKFSLQYHERQNDKDESNIHFGESNPFFSSFWLERQWIFETEITCDHTIYSVRPYRYTEKNFLLKTNSFISSRKRWYEQLNVDNSTMEFSKSIRLSLSYIPPDEYYEVLITDIKTILSLTQIHHLEISNEQTLVDILMEITNALPQVTTMKLHSLSLDQAKGLETDELIVFPSTTSTNQITKVYLEKMSAIEEVYSLMKLYPNMSYLKIDSFDNMKIDAFIRNILKKINRESNQYLRSLCFRAPANDDSMIKTLKKMKKDYAINRIDNYIFLQWK